MASFRNTTAADENLDLFFQSPKYGSYCIIPEPFQILMPADYLNS